MNTLVSLMFFVLLTISLGCKKDAASSKPPAAYLSGPEIRNVTKYFGYVANYNDGTVNVFSIDKTSKDMEAVETVTVGINPRNAVVHPTQKFYYVNLTGEDAIGAYAIDPATGSLSLIEKQSTGDYPNGIAITPDGEFMYVTCESSAKVFVYTINTVYGHLDYIAEYNTGYAPHEVAVFGDYVYVANYSTHSNSVSVFSRNSATGLLTLVETQASGTRPVGMDATAELDYLFVANRVSNDIESFSINNNGSLTSKGTFAAGSAPIEMVVSDGYVYTINFGSDTIGIYEIDRADGSLAHLEDYDAGDGPNGIIKPSFGDFLIVVNDSAVEDADSLDVYGINNDGTLSMIATDIEVGDKPMSVTVATTTYQE